MIRMFLAAAAAFALVSAAPCVRLPGLQRLPDAQEGQGRRRPRRRRRRTARRRRPARCAGEGKECKCGAQCQCAHCSEEGREEGREEVLADSLALEPVEEPLDRLASLLLGLAADVLDGLLRLALHERRDRLIGAHGDRRRRERPAERDRHLELLRQRDPGDDLRERLPAGRPSCPRGRAGRRARCGRRARRRRRSSRTRAATAR